MSSPPQSDKYISAPRHYSPEEREGDLFHRCWHQQECWDCLGQELCSWCPTTSTCIPNTYAAQILAPIFNPDACPFWSERWELRARPFGCHVSTITLITCIISVLSTFLLVGLGVLGLKATQWSISRWKARQRGWWRVWRHYRPDWWKGWKLRLRGRDVGEPLESRPLLA